MGTVTILPTSANTIRDTRHFIKPAVVPPSPSPTPYSFALSRLCLPDPPSLYPSLITIGADEKTANEMNRAHSARALELRLSYEKSVDNAFAALRNFPHDWEKRILDTFASMYLTTVKSWVEDGVAAYKSSRKLAKLASSNDGMTGSASRRRAFKTDYIPLLEHFFDESPFPTQADKSFLAKKSGMTYRQIHVWFQNRRNRNKKPDGTWRKKPSCEPPTLPLDSLRARMGKHMNCNEQVSLEPHRTLQSSSSLEERSMPVNRYPQTAPPRLNAPAIIRNVLDTCTAPSHAFPSPYPPVCPYEPFPIESRRHMFSAFQWERFPNRNGSPPPLKIEMDDLVDQFALLNVRDVSRRSHQDGRLEDFLAATYSITITPPPAPHPALIKSAKSTFAPPHLSPFPIVRASQPIAKTFVGSTPTSVLISPPSVKNTTISRRKASSLPKRHPQSTFPYRNVTPATSDTHDSSSSALSPCSSVRSLSDPFGPGETLSQCYVLAH